MTALEKLDGFVAGHIAIAAKKSPAAARRHRDAWADQLHDWMLVLGTPKAPPHMEGLMAFDLANARDILMSEKGMPS